jgi:hypothetical protein
MKASIKSKNITYDQQLALEYSGYFDALKKMIAGSIKNSKYGLFLSLAQFEAFSDFNKLLNKWEEYGGAKPELDSIINFLNLSIIKKYLL